jgi:hypothetical protein
MMKTCLTRSTRPRREYDGLPGRQSRRFQPLIGRHGDLDLGAAVGGSVAICTSDGERLAARPTQDDTRRRLPSRSALRRRGRRR